MNEEKQKTQLPKKKKTKERKEEKDESNTEFFKKSVVREPNS